MKVIIQRIKLENFKSSTGEYLLNPTENLILGKNGIGKSNIVKAVNWAITGYPDPCNKQNHEIYDNRYPITHTTPETSVEVELRTDDDRIITLKRTAQPSFTLDKGTGSYVRNATDIYRYFWNGNEEKAKSFNNLLSLVFGNEKYLKYNINGNFFLTLIEKDKEEARKLLEPILPTVNYDGIKEKYTEIKDMLSEDFDAKVFNLKQLIKKINTQFDEDAITTKTLEQLLKEHTNAIVDVDTDEYETLSKKVEELKAQLNNLKTLDLQETYFIKQKEFNLDKSTKANKAFHELSGIKNKYTEQLNEYNTYKIKLDNLNTAAQAIKDKLLDIEQQHTKYVNAIVSSKKQDNDYTCPTCGAALSGEQLSQAKAIQQQYIDELSTKRDEAINQANDLTEKLAVIEQQIAQLVVISKPEEPDTHELEELISKLNNAQFEDSQIALEIKRKMNENDPEGIIAQELSETSKKLTKITEQLQNNKFLSTQIENTKIKLENLEQDAKQNRVLFVQLNRKMMQCEEYTKERNNAIQESIDSVTKNYDFKIKLFETLKNGVEKQTVILTNTQGVNLSTINNSQRIKIISQVQKLFNELTNNTFPIFIDESSVFDNNSLPTFKDTQSIYLRCSEDEKITIL